MCAVEKNGEVLLPSLTHLDFKDAGHIYERISAYKKSRISRIQAEHMAEQSKNEQFGRNELCPCGSGKKYKKCCLDKDNAVIPSAPTAVRIEDKYDLLEQYPKNSPLFNEIYEKEAIDIDISVYMALHHRAIPVWVKRDMEQERIGKINYLNEALKLFLEKCGREDITTFSAYDKSYMVHYRSADWVEKLIDLTKDEKLPAMKNIWKTAMDVLEKFNGKSS